MPVVGPLRWRRGKLGFLAVLGVVGPAMFVASSTLLPLFRPDRGLLTDTISSLEIGQYGSLQRAALLATGICSLILALGVRETTRGCRWSRLGSGLIGLWSVGIFLAGVFPHYPDNSEYRFFHGMAAWMAFLCSVAGILVLCMTFEQEDGWRAVGRWSLVLGLAALGILLAPFILRWFVPPSMAVLREGGGALERIFFAPVMAWLVLVALRFRHIAKSSETAGAHE